MTTGSLLYFLVYVPWRNGAGKVGVRSVTLRQVVIRAVESNALSLVHQTLIVATFATADKLGFVYSILAFTIVKVRFSS